MKKITYLMMFALGISAVSTNINAESKEELKIKKNKRKVKIKERFKNTCSKAGASIMKGDIKGAIGDLKKGMNDGLNNWRSDGTLVHVPPQVINEIQSSANMAYAEAEKLANAGDRKEAKKIIDDLSTKVSTKIDSALASIKP